jgi:hypothetical protein
MDPLTIRICTLSSDLHRLQTVQIRRKGADLPSVAEYPAECGQI